MRPALERAFPGARGPVTLLQFREGHSNLTYLVRIGGQEAVLRRAPFGTRVKSAHDMGREFSILSAIQGVYPRAPRPIVFCEDESLIGARFYLMERVRGVVLRGDASAPGLTPDLLRAASTALVDNLAELHGVDLARTGLASTGKPQGYVGRQVAGWTERYARARTDEIPQIEAVAAWLAAHLPPESGAPCCPASPTRHPRGSASFRGCCSTSPGRVGSLPWGPAVTRPGDPPAAERCAIP
ncbi:MAG TPA: phosphotransferase family protein [Anaeromyxobacteraceae bacterium]|nr:phosphotransferase family protein [Anaeromyxobacteraceae bacterium]